MYSAKLLTVVLWGVFNTTANISTMGIFTTAINNSAVGCIQQCC